jgi:hypothetical protein
MIRLYGSLDVVKGRRFGFRKLRKSQAVYDHRGLDGEPGEGKENCHRIQGVSKAWLTARSKQRAETQDTFE